MTQEIFENELSEKEIKADKTKKVLIVVLIMLLFLATYYYYIISKQGFDAKQASNPANQIAGKIKTEVKPGIGQKAEKPIIKPSKTNKISQTTINPYMTIKPSNKMSLIRLAAVAAGKPDPFAGSDDGASYNFKPSNNHTYTRFNSLPPPPASIGSLPAISELPKINFPQGQSPYRIQEPEDLISVKGFWGDKVIVSINGITESLRMNQSFQGVKVVNIDPEGLVARFKKNGKTITKRIKDMSNLENKSDLNGNELRKLPAKQSYASAFFAPGSAEKLVKDLNR